METDRRGMLGAIFGSLAAMAGGVPDQAKPIGERAFFRYDGKDWRRVAFEDLKVGDRVFQVDFGETFRAVAYRVDRTPYDADPPNPFGQQIDTSEDYDVMPRVWGIRTDETACQPPMIVIEGDSIDQKYVNKILPWHAVPSSPSSLSDEDIRRIRDTYNRGFISPSEAYRAIQAENSPRQG